MRNRVKFHVLVGNQAGFSGNRVGLSGNWVRETRLIFGKLVRLFWKPGRISWKQGRLLGKPGRLYGKPVRLLGWPKIDNFEYFHMFKSEIANSKNMASLKICPTVDNRQKRKKSKISLNCPLSPSPNRHWKTRCFHELPYGPFSKYVNFDETK